MDNALKEPKPLVLFIINSIGFGGAERALVNILHFQASYSAYDVHLVLLDDEPIVRTIPANITLHVLNSKRSLLKSVINLFKFSRKLKPSICISFLVRSNISNVLIAKVLGRYPTIICERMHLDSHLSGQYSGIKRTMAKLLPKLIYHRASRVLGVSTGVTDNLIQNFNVPRSKASTIYNPYNVAAIEEQSKELPELTLPENFIISVGRLTGSKNFECLIKAYLNSKEQASLVILGTGEKENELRNFIKQNNAENRIKLVGYVANPFSIINKAKYFISTSQNEGFPNAMLEAMVLRIPIIMSNCPSGPAEILQEDAAFNSEKMFEAKFGILVPMNSEVEFTKAINLYQENSVRQKYSVNAKLRSKNFEMNYIAKQYWDCISETLQQFSK